MLETKCVDNRSVQATFFLKNSIATQKSLNPSAIFRVAVDFLKRCLKMSHFQMTFVAVKFLRLKMAVKFLSFEKWL